MWAVIFLLISFSVAATACTDRKESRPPETSSHVVPRRSLRRGSSSLRRGFSRSFSRKLPIEPFENAISHFISVVIQKKKWRPRNPECFHKDLGLIVRVKRANGTQKYYRLTRSESSAGTTFSKSKYYGSVAENGHMEYTELFCATFDNGNNHNSSLRSLYIFQDADPPHEYQLHNGETHRIDGDTVVEVLCAAVQSEFSTFTRTSEHQTQTIVRSLKQKLDFFPKDLSGTGFYYLAEVSKNLNDISVVEDNAIRIFTKDGFGRWLNDSTKKVKHRRLSLISKRIKHFTVTPECPAYFRKSFMESVEKSLDCSHRNHPVQGRDNSTFIVMQAPSSGDWVYVQLGYESPSFAATWFYFDCGDTRIFASPIENRINTSNYVGSADVNHLLLLYELTRSLIWSLDIKVLVPGVCYELRRVNCIIAPVDKHKPNDNLLPLDRGHPNVPTLTTIMDTLAGHLVHDKYTIVHVLASNEIIERYRMAVEQMNSALLWSTAGIAL
eukprot:Lankesteria_metandrocarpae@DN6121_c0_g1_i1.p1